MAMRINAIKRKSQPSHYQIWDRSMSRLETPAEIQDYRSMIGKISNGDAYVRDADGNKIKVITAEKHILKPKLTTPHQTIY